jgi:hypothetical protein
VTAVQVSKVINAEDTSQWQAQFAEFTKEQLAHLDD